MSLRQAANALLSALIAPPCAVCARVLDTPLDGAVCETCWRAVSTAGLKSHPPNATALDFSSCRSSLARLDSVGLYEGNLREILHALKYDGRRSVAPRLSHLMATHGANVLAGADLAVPVPLHPRRQRERGFNQAEDLARGLGLPVQRVLRRTRMTRPQVDLPAAERRGNVLDAFAVVAPGSSCNDKIIVLIDDVTTTGATLDACARVLQAAGARQVRALTAARVATEPR